MNINSINMFVFILLSLLLTGCATSYQPHAYSGGYSEKKLSENVYRVSFSGNGYTPLKRATNLSLLRTAEVTIEAGYNYFVLLDESTSIDRSSSVTTPVTTTLTYGNGYGTATSFGGQSIPISKPSRSNTFQVFIEEPENVRSYNAQTVLRNLTERYRIKLTKPRFGYYPSNEFPIDLEYQGDGVYVERVVAGSPVELAGLIAGDVILSINSVNIKNPKSLRKLIRNIPESQKEVQMEVLRGVDKKVLPIILN